MIKNLFLTVLLILVVLAVFVVVGTPKLANSSASTFIPAPVSASAPAPAVAASAPRPSSATPAAAPASAPRRIGPGGKAVVARDSQMILEYGTWRVPAGTEVQIVEILGPNAKVRANGQEGTIVVSALQP